jgi:hypothetical protein
VTLSSLELRTTPSARASEPAGTVGQLGDVRNPVTQLARDPSMKKTSRMHRYNTIILARRLVVTMVTGSVGFLGAQSVVPFVGGPPPSSWHVLRSQDIGAPTGKSGFGGVSCGDSGSCTAVGGYQVTGLSSSSRVLIESWNGTRWSVVPSPDPGPTNADDSLHAVSCTSRISCIAVGSYVRGEGFLRHSWSLGTARAGLSW